MISLVCLILILSLVLFLIPSKEKFVNYIGVHKYHKDSYKLGLHGKKKNTMVKEKYFGKFSDYIPMISHLLL